MIIFSCSLALLLLVVGGTMPVSAQEEGSLACSMEVAPSDSGSGRFGDVAPGRAGRLAWTDGRRGQFLMRDGQGHERVVGRPGAGPGEFLGIGQMDWIGDTLWVSDVRLPRVQHFNDTGQLVRTTTAILPANWGARPDGRLVGSMYRLAAVDVPWTIVAFQSGATVLDTIATFPMLHTQRVLLPARGREVSVPEPLLPATVLGESYDKARFCAADPATSGSVRLRCVNDQGESVLDQTLRLGLRGVSDSVYEGVIQQYSRAPGRSAGDMRDRLRRPRQLPAVLGIVVENGGTLWLRRSHPLEGVARWLRVTPDGTPRDTVIFPNRYRILRVAGDTVWAAAGDADGVETLYRCRVQER